VSGAKVAGWVAGVGGGNPKLLEGLGELEAFERGAAPAGAGAAARVACTVAVEAADGCALPVGELSATVDLGDDCAGAWADGSARCVTVPLIEKSRNCAGPTASSVLGGGGAITGIDARDESASCASAGAARPIASAMAAELKRNPSLILTRLSGWSRTRFARRLRRFAAQPSDIQAYAG